jgi:hypothetical protein
MMRPPGPRTRPRAEATSTTTQPGSRIPVPTAPPPDPLLAATARRLMRPQVLAEQTVAERVVSKPSFNDGRQTILEDVRTALFEGLGKAVGLQAIESTDDALSPHPGNADRSTSELSNIFNEVADDLATLRATARQLVGDATLDLARRLGAPEWAAASCRSSRPARRPTRRSRRPLASPISTPIPRPSPARPRSASSARPPPHPTTRGLRSAWCVRQRRRPPLLVLSEVSDSRVQVVRATRAPYPRRFGLPSKHVSTPVSEVPCRHRRPRGRQTACDRYERRSGSLCVTLMLGFRGGCGATGLMRRGGGRVDRVALRSGRGRRVW